MSQATMPSTQTLMDVLERVQALNLERITRKVERKLGWDADRANQAEQQYRRYLALLLLYPEEPIALPSNDADEIWHGHILDTPAYQEDCEELFGAYLHHVPSYGSAEEKVKMASAREQTEALYQRHFGNGQQDGTGTDQDEAFWTCLGQEKTTNEALCVCGCCICMAASKEKEEVKVASKEKKQSRAKAAIVKKSERRRSSSKSAVRACIM